jgi:hypothetical protein
MMQEVIIETGRVERHYWRDLWQYRELLQVLAWRDVAVRYKQTVIGRHGPSFDQMVKTFGTGPRSGARCSG